MLNINKEITSSQKELDSYLSNPDYLQLLFSYSINPNKSDEAWMNEPYPRNPKYKEQLTHPTVHGLKVRSKSESLIALLLAQNGISFRYECQLAEQGPLSFYYPDFTIRHPITHELIYWEHFGYMDDHKYVEKHNKKIHVFINNGIIPGNNLICTYETESHPLHYDTIIHEIQLLLLRTR